MQGTQSMLFFMACTEYSTQITLDELSSNGGCDSKSMDLILGPWCMGRGQSVIEYWRDGIEGRSIKIFLISVSLL